MSDPELVARAQRAAARLERSWERWRTRRGLGGPFAQPVASYVGYSPEEPRRRPRVVFGVDAVEAEELAVLLDGATHPGAATDQGVGLPGRHDEIQGADPGPGGCQAHDAASSIAAELAGWAASELPGHASAGLAAWTAAGQESRMAACDPPRAACDPPRQRDPADMERDDRAGSLP